MDLICSSSIFLLPDELLDDIFQRVTRQDQCRLALASRRCYRIVIPHLYRSIELVDCRGPGNGPEDYDEHDDTPMIKMILLLATNEFLASKVQTLLHKCHLPLPGPFTTLQILYTTGETLSCNVKVRIILRRAIANMTNVRTLRIIFGHAHITNALLCGFFDPKRTRNTPVRRLWIESSHLCAGRPHLDFDGLESLRLRRLRLGRERRVASENFVLSRGGLQLYIPEWSDTTTIARASLESYDNFNESFDKADTWDKANSWDEAILKKFPHFESLYQAAKPLELSGWDSINPPIRENVGGLCYTMVPTSAPTLVSLCLDWCFGMREFFNESEIIGPITFLKLRALQIRNASMAETSLRADSFLFDEFWSSFLSRHPKLQCLAWPMEHFFAATPADSQTLQLVDVLGRELKVLRVDGFFLDHSEPLTDMTEMPQKVEARRRRRLFIENFATSMASLEILKIEGGIPYDEAREIVKAVKQSPLRKLVLIGVRCPIAPLGPQDLLQFGLGFHAEIDDPQSLWYGVDSTPRLQTIATHYATTMTEMKFCGFGGAPSLLPVALDADSTIHNHVHRTYLQLMFSPLRYFHKLRHISIAWSLNTFFDRAHRDAQVIAYWANAMSPSSTALAVVDSAGQGNCWADVLERFFAPAKLARVVADAVGPHLSPTALTRSKGVTVDALFLMGDVERQDIFHFTVAIGAAQEVLWYEGPLGEYEERKLKEKLETRSWF